MARGNLAGRNREVIARIVRDNLLAIARAYGEATGASLTQVSKEFYGNGTFFVRLRRGTHTLSVDKLDAMMAKFRERWPAEAKWPVTRAIFMGRDSYN